jgi:hypothetical protein
LISLEGVQDVQKTPHAPLHKKPLQYQQNRVPECKTEEEHCPKSGRLAKAAVPPAAQSVLAKKLQRLVLRENSK